MSSAPNRPATPEAGATELRAALLEPRARYGQAVWLSAVIGVLILAPSWYMFEVYGRVLNSRNVSTLAWLLGIALVIYVVLELLELARSRALRAAAETITRRLTARAFDASFSASLKRLPAGNGQAPNDVKTLADFVHGPAVTGVLDLPSGLLCLLLLFVMNIWLGVLATVMAMLQVLLGWLQHQRGSKPYGEANAAASMAQQGANGMLRNAPVVAAMGMQPALFKRWDSVQGRYLARLSAASDSAGTLNTLSKGLSQLQGSLLLGLACWAALDNSLAGGAAMVIVASILGGRVLAPMGQIVGQWRQIGAARTAWQRTVQLLGEVPKPGQPMELPEPVGHLTVEGIVVTPPGSATPVLKGVSFAARPGELLTVIGPSAAGKTSLARALVGVWPSASGTVRLDSADVVSWPKDHLGPHVGYLPQGIELFEGSVAENIARFGDVDRAKVEAAARQVGIHDAIEQLPQGYDSQVGSDGEVLSGGQRQRIGLARAIYGEPKLVVLDEPNAHLDEAGEAELLALIGTLKARGATVVAITHRAKLVHAADRLLLLQDGVVLQFGTKAEVLAAVQAVQEKARASQAAQAAKPAAPQPGLPMPAIGVSR